MQNRDWQVKRFKKCCRQSVLNIVCYNCDKKCGDYCVYFPQRILPTEEYFQAKWRICRNLFSMGFRMKPNEPSLLVRAIHTYKHFACQPERLSEETYFGISNLFTAK